MTIDEAIKRNETIIMKGELGDVQTAYPAVQLGIEALKFTKNLRDTSYITKIHLLPGESKD